MPTATVEDYLKRIFVEQQNVPGDLLPTGQLATAMAVTPGTATSMVKALADSGLIEYEPRRGVKLTPSGQALALHVLRRHRLIEQFLVQVLGLDWSEVHEEAERLEHAVSDSVLERIDLMLGRPRFDPHGAPIPDAQGQVRPSDLKSLSECGLHQALRISRVVADDPEFLRFAEATGLTPGSTVVVESRDPSADAVVVHPSTRPRVTLGTSAAARIFVERA